MGDGLPRARKPGREERAGIACEIEPHPERSLIGILECTDPLALAYLWVAVDQIII